MRWREPKGTHPKRMKVKADEYYLFQKAADEMLVGDKRWRSECSVEFNLQDEHLELWAMNK